MRCRARKKIAASARRRRERLSSACPTAIAAGRYRGPSRTWRFQKQRQSPIGRRPSCPRDICQAGRYERAGQAGRMRECATCRLASGCCGAEVTRASSRHHQVGIRIDKVHLPHIHRKLDLLFGARSRDRVQTCADGDAGDRKVGEGFEPERFDQIDACR